MYEQAMGSGRLSGLRAGGQAGSPAWPRESGKRSGRPPRYQERAFVVILARIREDHGQPCGTLLVPLIRGMRDFLVASKEPDYGISDECTALRITIRLW
jgi:hypothetical protein